MKKEIWIPMLQGMLVTLAFLLIEIVFQKLGFFNGTVRLYLTDSTLRFIAGMAALVFINRNYKLNRSKYSLGEYCTKKIPARTYNYLFPFFLYLISILILPLFSNRSTMAWLGTFGLNCLQQIGTGFYEEGVRVLIMCGLLKYLCHTKADRIKSVLISGALFGLSHALNFFFNNDMLATLLQVGSCFLWGMFMAAIFVLSENMILLMILHAVWDIAVRVPNAFFGFPDESQAIEIIGILQDVIQYGLMPFTAIMICLHYNKGVDKEIEKSIARVKKMEKILDRLNLLTSLAESDLNFSKTKKKLLSYQAKVKELENYYSSPEWKKDFKLDEEGKIPQTIKRGVISEDGIYDALERNKELMAEIENIKSRELLS